MPWSSTPSIEHSQQVPLGGLIQRRAPGQIYNHMNPEEAEGEDLPDGPLSNGADFPPPQMLMVLLLQTTTISSPQG